MAALEYSDSLANHHQCLINQIKAEHPSARTRGFLHALRNLDDAEYMSWLAKEEPGYYRAIAIIPDVFVIDHAKRLITIFEAVYSHDLDPRKFGKICDLAFALDEDRYELVLVRVDFMSWTVFDPRAAYAAHCADLKRKGEPFQDREIVDWRSYTAERCFERPEVQGVMAVLNAGLQ